MEEILKNKLHEYIRENNPDLLFQMEQDNRVTEYLSDKISTVKSFTDKTKWQPSYILEEICMDILTKELRPSKYNYISNVLEEEFENKYYQFHKSGVLRFEIINLINKCQPAFDSIGFTEENEDSRELRYEITGLVSEYIDNNK